MAVVPAADTLVAGTLVAGTLVADTSVADTLVVGTLAAGTLAAEDKPAAVDNTAVAAETFPAAGIWIVIVLEILLLESMEEEMDPKNDWKATSCHWGPPIVIFRYSNLQKTKFCNLRQILPSIALEPVEQRPCFATLYRTYLLLNRSCHTVML